MTSRRVTTIAVAAAAAALLGACGRAPVQAVAARPNNASEAPRVTPGPLEVGPLLGDLPSKASRFGAGPVAIVVSGTIAEGERVGAFVEIPKDVCLLAYARSSASLEDIDLAAFAEEGNPVVVDEGPDPKPTIVVCPPHPDRVYLAVHAAVGEGLCVIAAQLVPRDRAELVGRAVDAHGSSPKSPEAWPGLEDRVRAHRAAIGGTWEEQRRVAIGVDSRSPSLTSLTIDEDGCADVVVVPDDDVAVIDVDAFDGEGRLVARAKDTAAVRTLTICSSVLVTGSLQVRPHVGRGLVAVVVAKAKGDSAREMLTRPDVAWTGSGKAVDRARIEREQALVKGGYAAATTTVAGQLQLGRRATIPIDLPAAPCARIDVVGGAPLALVDAAVWDPTSSLLATAEGTDGALLFACGKRKARIDLGTRGRPGPFALLVRPERWNDPVFASFPLAASRMLGRAASSGRPLGGLAQHVSLEASKRSVQDLDVPAGQCVRVSVGAEGDGTGLETRLFDAATGEEVDRSHGQVAAGVRACAGATAKTFRLETRASAGKLDAVLGIRVADGA